MLCFHVTEKDWNVKVKNSKDNWRKKDVTLGLWRYSTAQHVENHQVSRWSLYSASTITVCVGGLRLKSYLTARLLLFPLRTCTFSLPLPLPLPLSLSLIFYLRSRVYARVYVYVYIYMSVCVHASYLNLRTRYASVRFAVERRIRVNIGSELYRWNSGCIARDCAWLNDPEDVCESVRARRCMSSTDVQDVREGKATIGYSALRLRRMEGVGWG